MKGLTKNEALEIENQVLRDSLEIVRRARDRLGSSQENGVAVARCLGSLDAAVNYEDCLERELRKAAARKKTSSR